MVFLRGSLDELHKKLEQEKSHVVKSIDELAKQDPFTDSERTNDNADASSEASEEFNHDRVVALVSELNHKLQGIDATLQKIGNGTYGLCDSCGQQIEGERLKILPTAQLCLSCERRKI